MVGLSLSAGLGFSAYQIAAASPGSLTVPLVAMDLTARTVELDMAPQAGVTYTVVAQNVDGSYGASLGDPSAGTVDVTSTVGKSVYIKAVRGGDTAYSAPYVLDDQTHLTPHGFEDFTVMADGDLGAKTGWGTNQANTIVIANQKANQGIKNATEYSVWPNPTPGWNTIHSFRVKCEEVAAAGGNGAEEAKRFRWMVGYPATSNGRYFKAGVVKSQMQISVNAFTGGAVVAGPITRALSASEFILDNTDLLFTLVPIWDAGNSRNDYYLQVYRNGVALLTDSGTYNGGKGWDVSTYVRDTAASTRLYPDNFLFGIDTGSSTSPLNPASSPPGSYWPFATELEVRSIANKVFSPMPTTFAPPTVGQPAIINFSGFYSRDVTDFEVCLKDQATGEQLTDWQTFTAAGSNALGSHAHDMTEACYGREVMFCIRDAADTTRYDEHPLGTVPVYGLMPASLADVLVGANFPQRFAADIHQNRGLTAGWYYGDNSGISISTVVDYLSNGNPAGTMPDSVYAAGGRRLCLRCGDGGYIAYGEGGTYNVSHLTSANTTDFPISLIGTPSGGAGSASIGASGGTIVLTAEQQASFILSVPAYTPNGGSSPGGAQVGGRTLPTDGLALGVYRDGVDTSLIFKPCVADSYGAPAGFGISRYMQYGAATSTVVEVDDFPYFLTARGIHMPEFVCQLSAEMGTAPWICYPGIPNTAKHLLWAEEYETRWQAYLANPLIDESKKWRGPKYIEASNERWNFGGDYFAQWQWHIKAAADDGYISTLTPGDLIVDVLNHTYATVSGTTLLLDMPAGTQVWIGARHAAAGLDGQWAIIEAVGGTVSAGTTLPASFAVGQTSASAAPGTGTLHIRATINGMQFAKNVWAAKTTGAMRDIMRTVSGEDNIFAIYGCGTYADDIAGVVNPLMSTGLDGPGNEAYKKIDFIVGSHYANLNFNFNSGLVSWAVTMSTDTATALDEYYAIEDDIIDNQLIPALKAKIHGLPQAAKAAGADMSLWPKFGTYEGRRELSFDCANDTDLDAVTAFAYDHIFQDARWETNTKRITKGAAEAGCWLVTDFLTYENFKRTGTVNLDHKAQRYGCEYWVNRHSNPAYAAQEGCYFGLVDAIAEMAAP